MNLIVQYDNSKEEKLGKVLLRLDENPIIKTKPDEETSYLGLPFDLSCDYFYSHVQDEVKKYKNYIKDFVLKNSESPEAYKYVETTLNWLLIKYQKVLNKFVESPTRKEWRMLSDVYVIPNPKKLTSIKQDQEATREAFLFFHHMSKIQLIFIEDLILTFKNKLVHIDKLGIDFLISISTFADKT